VSGNVNENKIIGDSILVLQAEAFCTLDHNQAKLAKAEGLVVFSSGKF
jgi:hypothetical protein